VSASRSYADADGADPSRRPAAALISESVVLCEPAATVREVARRMAQQGASCALVQLGAGELGIVTDQDMRVRVVGGDIPLDAAIERAMTAPAFTVPAAQLGTEVMVEMINRGIRHVPFLSPRGEVLGVVSDIDLLAAETRTPFVMRRRIARAAGVDALVEAAGELRPTVVALHDARVAPTQLAAIIAAFADAITRRAIELLAPEQPGLPPITWLATGSMGRGEAFATSDIDSALAWDGADDDERPRSLAAQVLAVLARCGFAADENAASAAHPLFARSIGDWRSAIPRWFDRPDDTRVLIAVAVLADAHVVCGDCGGALAELGAANRHPQFLSQLRRLALAHRPPTALVREPRTPLDIKQSGFEPIVHLARYLALATGVRATGTVERLGAAAEAGAIEPADATTLAEAFELLAELRMGHQLGQLRCGQEPSDLLDPAELNPLTRRYLREAFRAIARVQRRVAS
jgi:CBS domain-containing protein